MTRAEQSADSDRPRLRERFGRSFAAGDILFREGDPAGEAYLLEAGRVRLIKRVGGTERGLGLLVPGDLFGESALGPSTVRTSTAVAVEAGLALALDPAAFRLVLAEDPAVGSRIVDQLVRRLRDAEDQIEVLMVRDGQTKVVVALVKLARQVTVASGRPGGLVSLRVSPMELATRVGLDVETVKQSVQRLRDAEYLAIRDERIDIPDVTALEALADLLGLKQHLAGEASPR